MSSSFLQPVLVGQEGNLRIHIEENRIKDTTLLELFAGDTQFQHYDT